MSDELLALENAATELREQGKHQEAAEKLQQILAQDESFVRAHLALAVAYHHLQDYDQAIKHAERAVELEPNEPFNYSALSITYKRALDHTRDPTLIEKAELAMERGRMAGQ